MKLKKLFPLIISIAFFAVTTIVILLIWQLSPEAMISRWLTFFCFSIIIMLSWTLFRLLREQEEVVNEFRKIENITENSSELICELDTKLKVRHANKMALENLGYTEEDLLYGIDMSRLFAKNERFAARKLMAKMFASKQKRTEVFDMQRSDNTTFPCEITVAPFFNEYGDLTCFHCFLNDITTLQKAEKHLEYVSQYDTVTGLPNIMLLKDRLTQAISQANRSDRNIALVTFDVVRFKLIKDSLGHSGTEALLKAISERLSQQIRQEDSLAHINNDEFAIILPSASDEESAAHGAMVVARKILNSILEPFTINGRDIFISGSVGIALYPNDAKDTDDIIQKADAAKYHAKAQGKNTLQFYKESFNAAAQERMNIEKKLRYALKDNEFKLHYQPIMSVRTSDYQRIEAFIYWDDKSKEIQYPHQFLHFAEENGLIIPIGYWAMETAFQALKAWQAELQQQIIIHINVSSRQLYADDFVDTVRDLLKQYEIKPQQLALEIKEDVLFKFDQKIESTISDLKYVGTELYLDNFWSGYSSTNIIKTFPLDGIKIDYHAIAEIQQAKKERDFISGIIAFAHHQDMLCFAEETETEESFELFKELGCDFIQGHYICKPTSSEKIIEFLLSNTN